MRLYTIVNQYYAGAVVAPQVQHSAVQLFLNYKDNDEKLKVIYDWAENHITAIIIRGGDHSWMIELQNELQKYDAPFAAFYEPANNNTLSSISILVSSEEVRLMKLIRENKYNELDIIRLSEQGNVDLTMSPALLLILTYAKTVN